MAMTEHTLLAKDAGCIVQMFPMASVVKFNAQLVNKDKPVQYVATLVWNKKYYNYDSLVGQDREITDTHLSKYYELISKVGKILQKSEEGATPTPHHHHTKKNNNSSSEVFQSKAGVVFKILDENFGLIQMDLGLVLFDTCDFWLNPNSTASKVEKKLEDVVKIGDLVFFHACMIEKKLKVAYLASSVWIRSNQNFQLPKSLPPTIAKKDIHHEKIIIYHKVVNHVANSLEAPEPEVNSINLTLISTWQKGVVRVVFFDKAWVPNGSLVAGIVRLTSSNEFAFFMSKNFAQLSTVPRVGMETYVNTYPIVAFANTVDSNKFGNMKCVCINQYAPFMSRESVGQFVAKVVEANVAVSIDLLEKIIVTYPVVANNPNSMLR
jgi:hypothetical protein